MSWNIYQQKKAPEHPPGNLQEQTRLAKPFPRYVRTKQDISQPLPVGVDLSHRKYGDGSHHSELREQKDGNPATWSRLAQVPEHKSGKQVRPDLVRTGGKSANLSHLSGLSKPVRKREKFPIPRHDAPQPQKMSGLEYREMQDRAKKHIGNYVERMHTKPKEWHPLSTGGDQSPRKEASPRKESANNSEKELHAEEAPPPTTKARPLSTGQSVNRVTLDLDHLNEPDSKEQKHHNGVRENSYTRKMTAQRKKQNQTDPNLHNIHSRQYEEEQNDVNSKKPKHRNHPSNRSTNTSYDDNDDDNHDYDDNIKNTNYKQEQQIQMHALLLRIDRQLQDMKSGVHNSLDSYTTDITNSHITIEKEDYGDLQDIYSQVRDKVTKHLRDTSTPYHSLEKYHADWDHTMDQTSAVYTEVDVTPYDRRQQRRPASVRVKQSAMSLRIQNRDKKLRDQAHTMKEKPVDEIDGRIVVSSHFHNLRLASSKMERERPAEMPRHPPSFLAKRYFGGARPTSAASSLDPELVKAREDRLIRQATFGARKGADHVHR